MVRFFSDWKEALWARFFMGAPRVGIDRTSKFAFVQLAERANTVTARAFLDALVDAVPYRIEIVLTDNGIQFADLPKSRSGRQPSGVGEFSADDGQSSPNDSSLNQSTKCRD